jgi:hypothetical protein
MTTPSPTLRCFHDTQAGDSVVNIKPEVVLRPQVWLVERESKNRRPERALRVLTGRAGSAKGGKWVSVAD